MTRESHLENALPSRTVKTHRQDGNRILDTVTLEGGESDGHFEAYQDVESETVQVNATTIRKVTRIFDRDGGGNKALLQTTEEETQGTPSGESKTVRIVSAPDSDGRLQPTRREISETKRISRDTQETKTTVMLTDSSGQLVPTMKIEERQQFTDNSTRFKKTLQLLDGAQQWQVNEVREGTITQEGSTRTTDEHVLRVDAEGKLSEVTRNISKESERSPGEKQSSVEKYSLARPGAAQDGSLHLLERVTSTQSTNSRGQQTAKQRVQGPDTVHADGALRENAFVTETVRSTPTGDEAVRTLRVRNGAGEFEVYAVDTTKSDKVHSIELH